MKTILDGKGHLIGRDIGGSTSVLLDGKGKIAARLNPGSNRTLSGKGLNGGSGDLRIKFLGK